MQPLILASCSPRRRQILGAFSVPIIQESHRFDEDSVQWQGRPAEYVLELALGKAQSVTADHPELPILAADTVVFCDGRLFEKPRDDQEAEHILAQLTGRWHTVYTAVCVACDQEHYEEVATTEVLFHALTPLQIHNYCRAVHSLDKAGAYTLEGIGGLIADEIRGCYYNVLGLPLAAVSRLLTRMRINLWEFLK